MSKNRIPRRTFLKATGAAAGLVVLSGLWKGRYGTLVDSIVKPVGASFLEPQTPLPGKSIPKYQDQLPIFFDRATNTNLRVDAGTHTALTIRNLEFQRKILPASMYSGLSSPFNLGSYVWGYEISDTNTNAVLGPKLYPAFTIEARRNTGLTVTYVNDLPINPVLQQYVTVDQTIHWADPLNQMGSRLPYTGPPPVVTHLHGGEVPSASDGGPDSWFTPGYGYVGPAWTYGGVTQNYTYPNKQEATTLFYHDHTLGATRLNLYKGLVGFYLIRDFFDTGVLGTGLNLPAGPYEMEIAIQDKMFDTNGQLLFPDGYPAGPNGPPPNPDAHPFWNPEFFGDAIVVNGKTWPYVDVEPRRYRLRFVNGANARFFKLKLSPKLPFWVIGADGGLLDKPVMMPELFLAPGERGDVIVDFAPEAGRVITMTNSAKAPYPSGTPPDPQTIGQIMQFRIGNSVTGGNDSSFNPAMNGTTLRGGLSQPPAVVRLANGIGGLAYGVTPSVLRMLTLVEIEGAGGPLDVVLNNTKWDGLRPDMTPVRGSVALGPNWLTELPRVGSTEQWDIINLTEDAHPIHLHLVQFQLINRQAFKEKYRKAYDESFPGGEFIPEFGPPSPYNIPNAAGALGGNPDVTSFLQGPIIPPTPDEIGWKDTFKMFPGQATRIIARWAPQNAALGVGSGTNLYPFDPTAGPGYVWHCHIVDHEDNEMMRPYKVAP